jgi:hypothetical protein
LDDPELFAPYFRGETWQRWRVFLLALFGLPMDDAALAIYRQHTGRTEPPTATFREAALIVGRRGGKSRVLALIATFLAAFFDYTPHLAPGEVATVGIIAADRKQARTIFRYCIGMLRACAWLSGMVEDETAETITLDNRVVIEIATANFRVTRGYTYAAVLADETAYWRDDESKNPDTEIFRALRPGLASIPTAILLNASSPYRKAGVLYTTYRRHFGKDGARVLVWQGTTGEMNPSLDPSVIEEAYEDDPESAAAEYGAQFREDLADFVTREVIDACTVQARFELLPVSGVHYVGFTDPAGGSGTDSMTLAIAHAEGEMRVMDALREVKPPFSPEAVVKEFAALLKNYRITSVVGDRYAGEWPRERFRAEGVTYELSDRPKSQIYLDMLPMLNSGKVELLDIPRLASQFCGLERRTARGGKDSIDHASVPTAHDDCCNAGAGALLLVQNAKPPIQIAPEVLARYGIRPGAANLHRRF